MDDSVNWTIPFLTYMVCVPEAAGECLDEFRAFAESFCKSSELKQYDEQLAQRDIAVSDAMFQQNQQIIGRALQQQNAAWDAVERQRDMISRDLDSFRSNLNASMSQNDAFMQSLSGGSVSGGGESSDDYIQRIRHESMAGVNTYVNDEGHETEFTTMADRVFESNLDELRHFGTEHYYDDYVPDGFTELRRK